VETVYELARNTAYIAAVQKATLTTKEFGLEPTHGLFGSEEWWRNIGLGVLRTHHLSGTITQMYMGSMGDWPMFVMVTNAGEEHRWTREVNAREQASLYMVGLRVEVDYVVQRFRRPIHGYDRMECKTVLAIRLEAVKTTELS